MKSKCGILFTRNDFADATGCLKPECHNDAHICQTTEGTFIEWENDYSCRCGCWDEDDDEPCIVYSRIDAPVL